MKHKRVSGFTTVELLIVIAVIAILASIAAVGYRGVTKVAADGAAIAHLDSVADDMKLKLFDTKAYPNTLSPNLTANLNVTARIKSVGSYPQYVNLTAVQNGTLLATICQSLINSGVGKAKDQAGDTQDYITGCGNWNDNKMQISGWDTRGWNTPVTIQQLRDYGNSFTTRDAYNKVGHEYVVKKFYNDIADTFLLQGGVTPITSFWDYWADSGNGGVMPQALPTNANVHNYYCAEAQSIRYPNSIWHVTETNAIVSGPC
jgi:prepilin-type N-terminal cleavage/methylation domain-containing protein